MAVTTANTLKLSDVCLEIYGSSSTSGKSLMGCFTDATGTFQYSGRDSLLDFRGYQHSDTEAPVFTTSLSGSNNGDGTASLSWQSTDNEGVTVQRLYYRRSDTTDSYTYTTLNSSATSYTFNGTIGAEYEFYVYAADAEGNSTNSNTIFVLLSDTITPTFTTSLSVTGHTSSSVSLAWASSDNVGVTSQRVYWRASGGSWSYVSVSASATSYTKSSLNGSTTYEFYIVAYDGASNSKTSNTVSETTNASITTYAHTLAESSKSDWACDNADYGYTSTFYTDNSNYANSTKLWTTSSASTYAPAGYYANVDQWKYWDGSAFSNSGACPLVF